MEEFDTRDLAEGVKNALRKRIISLPEEAETRDYVAVMAQVRALSAMGRRLADIDHALAAASDAALEHERARLTDAMALVTREMGR